MDAVLPMGLASSRNIFESFSSSLEWAAKISGVTGMVHLIEDFLHLADSSGKCASDTLKFEARLPEDKLDPCRSLLVRTSELSIA